MRSLTVHAIIRNAASTMAQGTARKMLERVADRLDFRVPGSDPQFSSVGATIVEFDADESAAKIGNVCPHCKREPCSVSMHPTQFGPIPAAVFSCSGCRKVLGVSIIPPPPMMERQAHSSPSGLLLPS